MKKIKKWSIRVGLGFLFLVLCSRFIIPNPSFPSPTSTVLLDSAQVMIGARIADDGQWRFPVTTKVSQKFEDCILQFEDQYFYFHPGINPVSLFRAIRVNLSAGRVKQGGSTITMQLARMLRQNQPRTVWQKGIEVLIALHLEINFSKKELLALYASHAPFGGNVVGIDAASWRYFNRSADDLSWAENAALAVLPNAPSLVFPGKNDVIFRNKRDQLLQKLKEQGIIDNQQLELALLEELPGKPVKLPNFAQHLLDRAHQAKPGERVESHVANGLQNNMQKLLNQYVDRYQHNEIYNGAILVLETNTGNIVAYVGNANQSRKHGNSVDIIKAPRSTGSLLKPFLYSTMLSHGELLPKQLIADVPTYFSGYSPKNFFMTFDGAVPADEALSRSLNVPFVRLLKEHGIERFYNHLHAMGMKSLVFPSNHYGLSLILGGAEGKLIELTSMYASMGRLLNYPSDSDKSPYFITPVFNDKRILDNISYEDLSPAAVYETFEALTEVNRPVGRSGWKSFSSSKKIAWKTGTSFGNKDAWAIGVTPNYVVGVWVGNADGEGRAGLTGAGFAAPIMFDAFEYLQDTSWFEQPYSDYQQAIICRESGRKVSPNCPNRDTLLIPQGVSNTTVCPYHIQVHLDKTRTHQVNLDCVSPDEMVTTSWFVLPPVQEWYFKIKSPLYQTLPPVRSDCVSENQRVMEFSYPKPPNKIFIPKELDGTMGRAVFDLVHRNPGSTVYWHLDGAYLGTTIDFHQLEIIADAGKHVLVVVDQQGNELIKVFEVIR